MQAAKSMQVLFTTMLVSLPALVNIGMLLVLVVFMFAVAGMQLFGHTMYTEVINHSANFESFATAFVTLVCTMGAHVDVFTAMASSLGGCVLFGVCNDRSARPRVRRGPS